MLSSSHSCLFHGTLPSEKFLFFPFLIEISHQNNLYNLKYQFLSDFLTKFPNIDNHIGAPKPASEFVAPGIGGGI